MKNMRLWLEASLARPIYWALMLGVIVACTLVLAIFDAEWRNGLKDFQIALGGLGALAAALAQHDGATAAVRETRRKDDRDRDELRRRLIIQCRLDAFNLNKICRAHAKAWSRQPPRTHKDVLMGLAVVPSAAAIEAAWAHIVLFSDEVAKELSDMSRHLMALAQTRDVCVTYSDSDTPSTATVSPRDIADLVGVLNSTADAAHRLTLVMDRYAQETDQRIVGH